MIDRPQYNMPASKIVVVLLFLSGVLFFQSCAITQDESGLASASREFLRPLDEQKKNILMERNAYDLAILEYFAKPGSLGLYAFDIAVLETEGETITITPDNGPPLEVLSHGLEVDWLYGGDTAQWNGEVQVPNSSITLPVYLAFVIRAIDASGETVRPDPNREVTRAALQRDSYVVLAESKRRLGERMVYGLVGGFIQYPARRTSLRFTMLGEDSESFGSVLVYELDESKSMLPGDDSPDNPTPPTPDMIRRLQEFQKHDDQVRRELGTPPREAY